MKKIVVFAGGRGTDSLVQGLINNTDVEITMLINAYDDGLSTGLVRRIIGNMLGPSDLRKNISRFASLSSNSSDRSLAKILEYRFDLNCTNDEGIAVCDDFINLTFKSKYNSSQEINVHRENLTFLQTSWLSKVIKLFIEYVSEKDITEFPLDFQDMSLGNIIFSGSYLLNNRDFNLATESLREISNISAKVLNITQGEALTLVAIKENGEFLNDEASIVSEQSDSRIKNLYLIPDSKKEQIVSNFEDLDEVNLQEEYLSKEHISPKLNEQAAKCLEEADLIIYGSGTQHSSLYPSYMTQGVFDKISRNSKARKIYIGNVQRDFDSNNETQTTLFSKFLSYLTRGDLEKIGDVVDTVLLHKPREKEIEDVFYDFQPSEINNQLERNISIIQKDIEFEGGKHSFTRTTRELLNSFNIEATNINYSTKLISIIIPSLNEEKFVSKTLQDVINFTERNIDYQYEIICVDGGSTDDTYQILNQHKDKITLLNSTQYGKGAALKEGLKASHGDIVVFYPCDDEYEVNDISRVINPLVDQEFSMVIGSRAYNSVDLNNRLKRVYDKKSFNFYLSKYGGMLLTIIYLLRYRRLLGDPLSSFKAINIRALEGIKGYSNGFDYEIEILAKLCKKKAVILEVPVTYEARSKKEGKKMNFFEGLRCLTRLLLVSIKKN